MTMIRTETAADLPERERLLDRAFGRQRRRKTSERLRAGRLSSEGLAFTAVDETGKLLGTIRLWDVLAGSAGEALMLGPLAVDCASQGQGIGAALMRHAIAEARLRGHRAIILVGDQPYYTRFGFTASLVADLHLPGPVERQRFLGIELIPGALDGAEGLVMASGRSEVPQREAA
jgi:predicted N-acetyltransferase YhbS